MVHPSFKTQPSKWTWTGARFTKQKPRQKQLTAPNLALLLIRARYYDPVLGEFISRDPLGFVDGMSLYRGYFASNGVDPTGLEWQVIVYAKAFGLGLVQGGANVVNGVQDGIIGIGNLPSAATNGGAYLVGVEMRAPYIPSPDWSRGLIVDERGLHDVSKFAGGQGALTLMTLGASQAGAAGQLGHVTSLDRAVKISSSGQLIGRSGIYALNNPSNSAIVNGIRTAGGRIGAVVPIGGAAAQGFRPIPVVNGPIFAWNRLAGGYVLPAQSLNLGAGTARTGSLLRVASPYLVDMGLGVGIQATSQTASGTINPFGVAVSGIPNEQRAEGLVIPATEFEIYIREVCDVENAPDNLPEPFSER